MCLPWRKKTYDDYVNLYVRKAYSDSKQGGDIIPGDVPVPTSDTLYYTFFEAEDGRQWCVTKIKTKFFFIIPFTYAQYVIDLGIKRYSSFTAEDAIHEIDEADHWNQRKKMHVVFSNGTVYFHRIWGAGEEDQWAYDIGSSDYSYLKYNE